MTCLKVIFWDMATSSSGERGVANAVVCMPSLGVSQQNLLPAMMFENRGHSARLDDAQH